VARLVERGLRRSVGVPGLFATAYGNVGSSIYYALGLVAAHALGLTPLVFMLAGGLFALTAKTYAEGASMYPEAGGSSSFARHAFNEIASFFAGWALTLDYIITIAISAFFVPHYLGAFWPALNHNPGDIIGGAAVVAVLALLNIRGLGESAKLNLFLAVIDLVTQVVLVAVGFILVLDPRLLLDQVHLGTAPSFTQLIFALSVAMVAYTGIETVSNMAEEAKDPGRDVPKAVNMVLVAVLGVYAGISVVALSALPVHEHAGAFSTALGTTYENDPVLGIVNQLGLAGGLQAGLRAYVGILAATILLIATNAGLIGVSRLSWSLSEHRQLPGLFARLHRRHRTPWFTIVVFSVLAVLLLIPGQTDFLGNLYSFGAMLSFTTAHVAVVALRYRQPDRPRPYRAPWNVRVRGREIPLTAVLGALGTFAAFVSVLVLHEEARTVGIAWMVVGMAGYFVYRWRSGLDPRRTYRVQHEQRPPDFSALGYSTAIVPLFGTDLNARALRRAARLLGPDAVVYALFVLRVPRQLPLEGGMEAEEAAGRALLESARVAGRKLEVRVKTGLIRTRNPGAALVDEARRVHADLLYLDAVHAPPSEQALGATATYLLARRPCRIVIETGRAAPVADPPAAAGYPAANGRTRDALPVQAPG
jgi:basic amino acid/polyamine antiporter, APA family